MIYVKDFKDGDKLSAQLLVVSSLKGVTNNGLTYLTLELRDSSGSINAKKWEVTESDEDIFVPGNVIDANFEVIFYKTSLQLKIFSAKKVSEDQIDVSKFCKQPPIPYEQLVKSLKGHIDSISEGDIKKVLIHILNKFKDKFLQYPGASSIHHEYQHGLLHHTVSMCDHASYLGSYYPNINHDLLIAGTILHDVGKTVELEGSVIFKYSLEGKFVFVDAYIADNPVYWVYCEYVNECKKNVASKSEKNLLVDTIKNGLVCSNEPIGAPDLAHYDSLSEIKLGHLFIEELLVYL